MASYRKLSNGNVRCWVRVGPYRDRPLTKTFPNKRLAVQWATAIEADVQLGRLPDFLRQERRLLSELIDRYETEVVPEKAKSTQRTDQCRLPVWRETLGHNVAEDLKPDNFRTVLKMLEKQGIICSDATYNHYRGLIFHVYRVALEEWDWVSKKPVAKVRKRKLDNKRSRFLSEPERMAVLEDLRENQSPHLRKLVLLGIYTGARKGELSWLAVKSCDFEKDIVLFLHEKDGGRRTKTRKSRSVPMAGPVRAILLNACRGKKDDDLLFASKHSPEKPMDCKTGWRALLRRCGIEDFKFHDLRHTFASNMTDSGADLLVIAELMGHNNIQTTKRYAHPRDERTRALVENMAERFPTQMAEVSPPEPQPVPEATD